MKLLEELSLAVYEQYATGRKVMQLGSNTVKSYNSMIPKLSWYSLLELHRFMKQVKFANNSCVHDTKAKVLFDCQTVDVFVICNRWKDGNTKLQAKNLM